MRFDREPILGIIDPQTFAQPDGLQILTPAGNFSTLPYSDVKAVCFVRDFDNLPVWKRNRIFASRPKTEGLWVRLRFRDSDQMDGVVSNTLLLEPAGLMIAPPDPTFQSQRIFVPRAAVLEARVLGVVGVPRHSRRRPAPGQIELFEK